jgi:hypothetical protein
MERVCYLSRKAKKRDEVTTEMGNVIYKMEKA